MAKSVTVAVAGLSAVGFQVIRPVEGSTDIPAGPPASRKPGVEPSGSCASTWYVYVLPVVAAVTGTLSKTRALAAGGVPVTSNV